MKLSQINTWILKHIKTIEMIAVLMRILSFSLVSWLGANSPFMLVWVVNTSDAIILAWCAILRKDSAYTVLNLFWVLIGIIGILRAGNLL
ncbi:MAG: hypothetical protein JNK81_08080 [Anaerolineales bacterium]|nr:hypothetical protein [Anaerolineales bacterium]